MTTTKSITNKLARVKKKPLFKHDSFFKFFFSNPARALDLFKLAVSTKEFQSFDWNKLKIEKDSFKGKYADLIFSVSFKRFPKIQVKIIFLLEHKAFHDKTLYEQVLDYLYALRKYCLKQFGKVFPILPVVFYHGEQALSWKKSLTEDNFWGLSEKAPSSFWRSMLNYEPRIIDVTNESLIKLCQDKGLKSYGAIRLLGGIWSLKNPTPEQVIEILRDFDELLKDLDKEEKREERKELIVSIEEYLRDSVGMKEESWLEAERDLIEKGFLNKGGYMDIKEFLKEKGRWEGEQKGLQEGLKEGLKKEQAIIANMLKKKMEISLICELTGLSEKEIKKIQASFKG